VRTARELAALASRAAIELDDLHRGRPVDFATTAALIAHLHDEFSEPLPVGGLVLIRRAFAASGWGRPMQVRGDVTANLTAFTEALGNPDAASAVTLRNVCISLSKQASATAWR
jgi:hypothetical protein